MVEEKTWKIDPIIRSVIDTDFYKLLMQQFIWEHYPNERVTWRMTNRTKSVRLADEIELGAVREQLEDPRSQVSEAYQSVRTALQFSTDHGVPRSLLVTSTRASEGKSSTALALAQTLANLGATVLLIDADLRKPTFRGPTSTFPVNRMDFPSGAQRASTGSTPSGILTVSRRVRSGEATTIEVRWSRSDITSSGRVVRSRELMCRVLVA